MANISMTQKDSITDQLEQLHQRIACRAYDLFRGRDGWGDAFGDWLSAEQELSLEARDRAARTQWHVHRCGGLAGR